MLHQQIPDDSAPSIRRNAVRPPPRCIEGLAEPTWRHRRPTRSPPASPADAAAPGGGRLGRRRDARESRRAIGARRCGGGTSTCVAHPRGAWRSDTHTGSSASHDRPCSRALSERNNVRSAKSTRRRPRLLRWANRRAWRGHRVLDGPGARLLPAAPSAQATCSGVCRARRPTRRWTRPVHRAALGDRDSDHSVQPRPGTRCGRPGCLACGFAWAARPDVRMSTAAWRLSMARRVDRRASLRAYEALRPSQRRAARPTRQGDGRASDAIPTIRKRLRDGLRTPFRVPCGAARTDVVFAADPVPVTADASSRLDPRPRRICVPSRARRAARRRSS